MTPSPALETGPGLWGSLAYWHCVSGDLSNFGLQVCVGFLFKGGTAGFLATVSRETVLIAFLGTTLALVEDVVCINLLETGLVATK